MKKKICWMKVGIASLNSLRTSIMRLATGKKQRKKSQTPNQQSSIELILTIFEVFIQSILNKRPHYPLSSHSINLDINLTPWTHNIGKYLWEYIKGKKDRIFRT